MDERNFSNIKIMWAIAMFDLPVKKKSERKLAAAFRKHLLSKGFTMLQFSVYAKFCSSRDSARAVINTIKHTLPPHGNVRVAMLTDKQFGEMYVFSGTKQLNSEEREDKPPEQLMLF
ncbi:CRISPR-associated endonuclease Cas2 [Candidatus Fermentibacteria bacterium]|nr:MAG: CRISPR-associated endonuclease Cas2 [Candidatus Fermentibacteria bacterium]